MCGIAGLLSHTDSAPVDATALAHMTGALIHRGPDDQGLFVAPSQLCGLGARRLSIIDLAGGHQPMSNEDGSCWVAQNGEIYNYKPLRAELEGKGHTFRSQSDTEVIVHAYEQWGEAFVERLWGMFALAIWDERKRQLLLARDRFGIKPLYTAQTGGQVLFASEVKALLRHPGFSPHPDPRSLEDMFTVGFVPGPATIWQQVERLPPAHALLATAGSGAVRTWRYWDASFPPTGEEAPVDTHRAVEQVLDLLADAVRLRLQSDVPVGALLSGGLDSSGIVALMQELSGGRAHTFSIGFEAASHDESAHALAAAQYLDTEHHVLRFRPQTFDDLPQVVRALDQPQCFATAVSIWHLYQACHQAGFKVILTGEGSDELFAGYHWLQGGPRVEPLLVLPRHLRRLLFGGRLPWPISAAARRALTTADATPVGRYLAWLQIASAGQRRALFTPDLQAQLSACRRPSLGRAWHDRFDAAVAGLAPLHQALTLERQVRLPDFINHEVDGVSMAHSVEARVPFLDHRLWELLAAWSPDLKLAPGRPGKWLLREAFATADKTQQRPYLPPAIRNRAKQGLATPHAAWWRQARMPDWVEAALSPETVRRGGLFVPETVADWRARHRAGHGDFSALLTGALNTHLWLEGSTVT